MAPVPVLVVLLGEEVSRRWSLGKGSARVRERRVKVKRKDVEYCIAVALG